MKSEQQYLLRSLPLSTRKTFTQPPNETFLQYVNELVATAVRRENLYGKHDMNDIRIKELDESIRQTMRGYWDSRQLAILHDLAFHSTSLLKLHGR